MNDKPKPFVIGEPIVQFGAVEQFNVDSDLGSICLDWTLPKTDWEEIEIVRQAEQKHPSRKKTGGEERTVYRGSTESNLVDHGVSPGQWYRYTLYVHNKGTRKSSGREHRGVCMAEVQRLEAAWANDTVRLTWDLPAADVSALVFRRLGGPPEIRPAFAMDSNRPTPLLSASRRKRRLRSRTARSRKNSTYAYRVILDFNHGHLTNGQDVQIKIPPGHRLWLGSAPFSSRREEDNEVALEWPPVIFESQVQYVVTRREGGRASLKTSLPACRPALLARHVSRYHSHPWTSLHLRRLHEGQQAEQPGWDC